MLRRHLLANFLSDIVYSDELRLAYRGNIIKFYKTFNEEFIDPISLYNPSTKRGRWKTNYDFGNQLSVSSRVLNDELQIYSDFSYNGVNPFVWTPGLLFITANVNKHFNDVVNDSRPYTSGLLTTSKTFSQRYGYFEIKAQLPEGSGLWPAFWLAAPLDIDRVDPQYPGEIDIVEMLGKDPNKIYCSAHWPKDQTKSVSQFSAVSVDVGSTKVLRIYSVLWTPYEIVWFIDRREIARILNPGLHEPMIILVNLAIGGKWGGLPDSNTIFPAKLVIEYIHAYQFVNLL